MPTVNRFALFALVVLALSALFGVAWYSRPVSVSAGQSPSASTVPVAAGLRGCPDPGTPGSRTAGLAIIAAAAGHGSGQATVSRLSAAGGSSAGSLLTLSQPGELSLSAVSPAPAATGTSTGTSAGASGGTSGNGSPKGSAATGRPGGVLIQARGSMAQGLEAEQTTSGTATASCGAPGTDFWFTGPGQQSAGSIQLYLMNVDNQPSNVDVDIVSDAGPLQGSTDTGIAVPPHGLVVQPLDGLVHGSRAIELHVRTSVGRVVAAVRESSRASQPGQWLPATQAPAKRLVIPGLPAASGGRALYVATPAESDAQVKLTVISSGGSYQPTGASGIDIPAGSASKVELTSLAGVSGAVVLTSNVPVTASFVMPGGAQGAPGAFAVAVPPVEQQGVVADGGGQAHEGTSLVITAPGAAVHVQVSEVSSATSGASAGSAGTPRVVSVPAKHSVTIKLGRPQGAPGNSSFAIVLTPLRGSGPVYAGRVLTGSRGTMLGIIPVTSAPTSIPLPQVRDSLLTVTP
ncbi:MAG TPA: DUF5719 family protein [Streptosporangiaceae bacterium]|jgi:hypothetical protein